MSTSFKSFVFLDLESTGLPFHESDGKRTRVTEICMISVTREHLLKCAETDNFCPRVQRKIILPINPGKVISPDASSLSGLDNFMLEHEEHFNEKITAVIASFLNTCSPPICLIAHNGYMFDFPLLKEEFKKFNDVVIPLDVCCSDSLIAFRELGKIKALEQFEYFPPQSVSAGGENSNVGELIAVANQRDRSPITLDPEITDIDLAFNEVAKEIERLHSPRKENGERKATDVIQRMNETTPKCQPLLIDLTSPCKAAAGERRRRLFADPASARMRFANNRKSFRLKDVHERLFGEEFANQHEAESDVIAMIKCCAKYGKYVVDWFESNNKRFSDIESMYK